ncbi:MAG TPA: GatB/YqeY domain-containing protein, partial [Bacteroidia bacterium]|nr:GatB/YqeY domain-containing protein [Bacteroidia bacterium]
MNLEQKIMAELKTAMLAKNEAALRALRAVKSAIILAKTSGSNVELSEADEMKLLQKLVKQRKESLDIFTQQNRSDLAKNEADEIAVIEKFLPAMMSADEVKEVLKGIIASM